MFQSTFLNRNKSQVKYLHPYTHNHKENRVVVGKPISLTTPLVRWILKQYNTRLADDVAGSL